MGGFNHKNLAPRKINPWNISPTKISVYMVQVVYCDCSFTGLYVYMQYTRTGKIMAWHCTMLNKLRENTEPIIIIHVVARCQVCLMVHFRLFERYVKSGRAPNWAAYESLVTCNLSRGVWTLSVILSLELPHIRRGCYHTDSLRMTESYQISPNSKQNTCIIMLCHVMAVHHLHIPAVATAHEEDALKGSMEEDRTE